MPMIDLRVWGKEKGLPAPYPLLWHLVDTAAVAGCLWDRYLTSGQRHVILSGLGVDADHAKRLVMLWAGLHDLGKATPGFQGQEPGACASLVGDPSYDLDGGSRSLRHERATQLSLMELLPGYGYGDSVPLSLSPCYLVAQVLGGHHGLFRQAERRDRDRRFLGSGGWDRQRVALVRIVDRVLENPKPPASFSRPAVALVTGLIILADWLASQEHFLREQLLLVPVEVSVEVVAAHLTALRVRADALLDEAGLGRPRLRDAAFEEVFPFAPNALQRSLIDELLPRVDGPGLLVVTAAMGDGKTEAALVPALVLARRSGSTGFYFALPTMATADQMYRRVRGFVAEIVDEQTAVTLLHSMSWLSGAYDEQTVSGVAGTVTVSAGAGTRVIVPDWLRGRKRGLLAQFGVGTVDQALMAALTTKHNMVRLLGLSGKVFIVDEAHSYDEYMQQVLRKLLHWLGAFGCPVILLSATIPVSQVRKLVDAYQRGAGVTSASQVEIRYPGWTFTPAAPGRRMLGISSEAQAEVASGRAYDLAVQLRPVRHVGGSEDADPDPIDRRLVIRDELAPLLLEGGCVAVVCNTVADAQATYEMVRGWVADHVEVRLLHSRFPAWQREAITEEITGRLGKDTDNRPKRMIVIATQVIEQSLDLDFDLVVSDLAPMAQLLQRAGRCHRHRRRRYEWARSPRLVVLDPQDGDGYAKPEHWGDVYHPYLLRATHFRLVDLTGVAIPGDVQDHVEAVYGPPFRDDDDLGSEYIDYLGNDMAEKQIADLWRIPDTGSADDLAFFSNGEISDGKASTRLGADSVRIVCCFVDGTGGQWLDEKLTKPLPVVGSRRDGRMSTDQVREVLRHSVSVRESLIDGYVPDVGLPEAWRDNAWLGQLQPLWFTCGSAGAAPVDAGGRHIHLDRDLGLVVEMRATRRPSRAR